MSQPIKSLRLTLPEIRGRKGKEKIVCLTACGAPIAAILDPLGDLMPVGDSLGMVVHGLPTTSAPSSI
jgi:3-methyl-2-oxobutanoate hydroxymethyltransferase